MKTLPDFKKWRGKSRGGFSMIEIIISIAIFSFVMLVVYEFYNVTSKSMYEDEVQVQFKQRADHVMDEIFYDMKQAGRPTLCIFQNLVPGVPQSGFFIPMDVRQRADNLNYAIGFQLPEGNSATGSILDSTTQITYGQKIIYYLNTSNNLIRAHVSAALVLSSEIVARSVTYFEVHGDRSVSPSYVEVSLNLQGQTMSKRIMFSGLDPADGLRRGSGSRISLRNRPSSEIATTESCGGTSNYGSCSPTPGPPGQCSSATTIVCGS